MIRKAAPAGSAGGGRRPAAGAAGGASTRKMPVRDDFLSVGDYTGAATLLEFQRRTDEADETTLPWLAYCFFHLGDHRRALEVYSEIMSTSTGVVAGDARLGAGACLYYLGLFKEAEDMVAPAPEGPLKTRLSFHIANKLGKDSAVLAAHKNLTTSAVDKLSLAAMQYMRTHYLEAANLYKLVLSTHKDDIAINVYMAMAYHKMDYYDVSMDALQVYLPSRAVSMIAYNLKACNQFRLLNGKAAEAELRALADKGINIEDSELMRHNIVVFRNGENALKVLPSLVGVVPEARLNLVIYHMRHGAINEAYELIKDIKPQQPAEFILKATVFATLGQRDGNRDMVAKAQQFFNVVGVSPTECDTIPGRQCMASAYFLAHNFTDVNIYLGSIKQYLSNDDDFSWNYGTSLAAAGEYKDAEDMLLQVSNPAYTSDINYLCWLARCFIMNRKARQAWELYLKMDTSPESLTLLQLIANDAYKTGAFYFSAKAFDVLQRVEPDPDYLEGLRGACVGVFQMVIAGLEAKENLREVVHALRSTASNPQVEYVTRIITRWAQANGGL